MKKIKDERLQLINLKNSRIAFLFQMIGLLGYSFHDVDHKRIGSGV
ncbi:MAG: hypothetical protein ABF586_10835 [Sporolactobacillus sp.]